MAPDIYDSYTQPILDQRDERHDLKQELMIQQEQQDQANLDQLTQMLTGAALDQGTLAPESVMSQAQSYGAGPRQQSSLASMLGGGSAAPSGLDDDDKAKLSQYVAAAANGISPRQLDANIDVPAGPPLPTERVVHEVVSLMRAAGYEDADINQAVAQIQSGYQNG